jgi:hypothetical protein
LRTGKRKKGITSRHFEKRNGAEITEKEDGSRGRRERGNPGQANEKRKHAELNEKRE